ncbi:hypothetical protein BDV36DRAFT_189004 [Aspergillus pseudocaelatus]|uniref:Secreted protein n=1 Tax=Aspergillus pseudocaelatus TaxID=1825620 RepID=A0ABQ6WIY9_9EURO|nr:hypothetical protein BDV36DRAFT_189004 [Aspergillus pseudocaelatus]
MHFQLYFIIIMIYCPILIMFHWNAFSAFMLRLSTSRCLSIPCTAVLGKISTAPGGKIWQTKESGTERYSE